MAGAEVATGILQLRDVDSHPPTEAELGWARDRGGAGILPQSRIQDRRRHFAARANERGDLKESFVGIARGAQLYSTHGAWDGDGRRSGQAEGRGVAEQPLARIAVIGAGREQGNGSGGKKD